ncbi:MAG: phosphoheptose isomerase [Elusimicrobia bacterium HGW-Elusimicrobia-1]|jgi:D-sedoheptulose 7-phosphate isomerase|nr:MAG: phosphoheptose isomerase [Elusimicrobia bacterium HGW-Elusimicrobia-1]
MKKKIEKIIRESAIAVSALSSEAGTIAAVARKITESFRRGGKLLVFGNGGSAADAQHFAAELVVKFEKKRKALPAIALNVNTSAITSCANDFSYEEIFSRQLEALLGKGDVVVGISTSGNSPNVVRALEYASSRGAVTVAFSGREGGRVAEIADIVLRAPSDVTARVQECHILAIHAVCKIVEETLCRKS